MGNAHASCSSDLRTDTAVVNRYRGVNDAGRYHGWREVLIIPRSRFDTAPLCRYAALTAIVRFGRLVQSVDLMSCSATPKSPFN